MTDDLAQSEEAARIAKMDAVADNLLKLVELESTSALQKNKMFEQVTNWYRVRDGEKAVALDDAGRKRIARMDQVAEGLLELIGKEGTPEPQNGKLFARVMTWHRVREKLAPADPGDKLREMSNALKSKGHKGSRDTGKRRDTARDGQAIRRIIAKLPAYGRAAGGNPARPEFKGGGADGDDIRVPPNGSGDVDRDMDGDGHVSSL